MRFPEYSGEWEVKKIIDFAPLQRGFDLPISEIKEGTYPVVFSNGILKKHNEYKAKAPGVVTGRSGTIGKVIYLDDNYWPHNTALWVTDFCNNYPKYVYYFYENFGLERFGTGSGVPTLNRNDLHIQNVLIPSLPEQIKIASFLSLIDERIATQIKIIEGLKELKVSLSKQIFSRKLRFKDENDRDFPEWEEKSLGEVGDVKMCKRIFNEQTTPEGDIPFYKIGSFGRKADAYISKDLYLEYKNKFSFPKKGEILISAAGTIGRTVVYNGEDAYYQDSNIVWIQNDNTVVSNEFLYYILQIVKYNTEGGTIQRLYNNILRTTKFNCPSLAEQFKIANFLSNIDSKIEAETKTYELLTKQKQSLLRQMFI